MRKNNTNRIFLYGLTTALAICLVWPHMIRAAGSWPIVESGIEYVHRRIGDVPWSMHVVKIQRSEDRFRVISRLAHDSIPGLASVREQLSRVSPEAGRPIVAVNGDFFQIRPGLYQGDPTGLHITEGRLMSAPIGDSFWIDPQGRPHIGPVRSRFRAKSDNGLDIAFGLNQERNDSMAVLYTPVIGRSTRTTGGIELVLQPTAASQWLPLRPGVQYSAQVAEISAAGDSAVRPQTMVLSISPKLAERVPPPGVGATISLSLATSPDLTGVKTAIGGGPVLVRDGKPVGWTSRPIRHPRTAVGFDDQHLYLFVVDGRQEGLSAGMDYPEMAEMLIALGCQQAMNLDGGGSSTLWLGGQVVNSPSDGRERRVANSLIVVAHEDGKLRKGLSDKNVTGN